ncbi:hypothetical protein GLAREA_02987 [Glarea lozoyensis ATCC 20868]|uniref:Pathway-specific nitrogen regulator n=1 Tax=Glarea lozoyensis (strain ATCC 20868 / MF5171) TaxID=1116229 RepID=S3DKI3_GLAL2|nr:uncharacterized protein GLAREA_02987 [Glarea lozoyensis ATCC 20868]EPE27073.1 hypothetical protein GLAREA_02987 [Glarea lozoyensis ATCC 20868]
MSPERNASNTTIVRHDSWSDITGTEAEPVVDADDNTEAEAEHEARERQIDRIEAQIQAAARAVVASIENDNYHGNEDSVLSAETDESYEPEGTEMTYEGTDISYGSEGVSHEGRNAIDGTEVTYASESEEEHGQEMDASEMISDSGNEEVSELNQDISMSEVHYGSDNEEHSQVENGSEHDDAASAEKLIQSIEDDDAASTPGIGPELRSPTPKENGQITKETVEVEELAPISEHDNGGDSSSHHDGDIDDDVFSHNSSRSARSSLNSYEALRNAEEKEGARVLTSPSVGEEANTRRESDAISRIPSSGSYMHPMPDAVQQTPSKVLSRPPFRTPSSVRAMQMSSPTPSIYNSPRSIKRHLPTVSRSGTPTSHTSRTRTPTRFKPKKEQPLVLLHVTVLPLQWLYSHVMQEPELPDDLHYVKENWRLLQDKLGDTVLERGILLPHPQDSFEILEERLLEALELPVRPRAFILKCGHYMGPSDSEAPSSDDEGGDFWNENISRRKWCDICRREVRLDMSGEPEGKRFRVKIFASNGLMHAGAWAAAWKEMERVDVEIGPWVEPYQHTELERLATLKPKMIVEDHDDGFEDEVPQESHQPTCEEGESAHHSEQLSHEIDADTNAHIDTPGEILESLEEKPTEEIPTEPEKSVADYENEMRELLLEEEQMRELHERQNAVPQRSPSPARKRSRASINEDSLSELLLAAFKVAMRDRKNIMIIVLSILVFVLALRPGSTPSATVPTSSSSAPGAGFSDDVTSGVHADAVVEVANVISETLPVASSIVGTTMPSPMKQQKPLRTSKQIRKTSAKSKAKPRGSVIEKVQTAESSGPEMKADPVSTETTGMGDDSLHNNSKAPDENPKHTRSPADEVAESGNDESDSEPEPTEDHIADPPQAAVPKMESEPKTVVEGKFEGDNEEMDVEIEEEDAENPTEAVEIENNLHPTASDTSGTVTSLEDLGLPDTNEEDLDEEGEGEDEEIVDTA